MCLWLFSAFCLYLLVLMESFYAWLVQGKVWSPLGNRHGKNTDFVFVQNACQLVYLYIYLIFEKVIISNIPLETL